jgi:hypothetical protein
MARAGTKKTFLCRVCGKRHEALQADVGCRLPDEVFALSYVERYERARFNDDLCTLDGKRHFIRCVLTIRFVDRDDEDFAWGVWVEVDKTDHDAYARKMAARSDDELSFGCTIANRLTGYRSSTIGLRVVATTAGVDMRPSLECDARSRHALAVEQRRGMDAARHHEIVAPVMDR